MFITNEPAMFIEIKNKAVGANSKIAKAISYNKFLLIGDLHLGMTAELRKKGITMLSQVNDFVVRIKELKKKSKASNLILIGDVKHKPQGISWQEEKELPIFFQELSKLFKEIVIVKGNHDGNIERLVKLANSKNPQLDAKGVNQRGFPYNKIKVKKTFVSGRYLITHGHMKLKKAQLKEVDTIIIAHSQPGVMFMDRSGARYVLPCWVRGKYNTNSKILHSRISYNKDIELIIIPAFNPLSGHTIVNKDKMLGPVAKKIKNAKAYLLDGTDIGDIDEI